MSNFIDAVLDNEADLLEQSVLEEIEAQFEDWEAAPGNLETWLIKAFARISSTVREQAAETSAAAFKKFGETIANVPPIFPAPATVASTWTMIDNAGYEIPAGTQVAIPINGEESAGFEVAEAVTVEAGKTATEAGEVVLQAIEPGEAGNGLSEAPELIDTLAFVESIALTGVSSGGVDEEDEDAYLDRLTEELQLLSLSLIVPRDFETDARAVAGVARALCIPGYDAEEETEENPLTLTVFPVDENGAALSSGVKEELQERQAAKVPSGVVNFVADPTFTAIDVTTEIVVLPGFDPEATIAAVKARLASYLSPANWGVPGIGDVSTSTGWVNATKVYLFELSSEIDRVPGVDRVISVKLAEAEGELKAEDVTLKGPAPLAEPGTIVVS
jgi:uncharacterized phage protein gp47/JayE